MSTGWYLLKCLEQERDCGWAEGSLICQERRSAAVKWALWPCGCCSDTSRVVPYCSIELFFCEPATPSPHQLDFSISRSRRKKKTCSCVSLFVCSAPRQQFDTHRTKRLFLWQRGVSPESDNVLIAFMVFLGDRSEGSDERKNCVNTIREQQHQVRIYFIHI